MFLHYLQLHQLTFAKIVKEKTMKYDQNILDICSQFLYEYLFVLKLNKETIKL